jgi:cysteine synthase
MNQRDWTQEALRRIAADVQRSADTHLIRLPLPPAWGDIALYLKDESSHPSGSLKHRLARSLFLHALVNGWLHEGCTVVEASSGSTAISEACFARLLELPFVAVMPRSTSPAKIAAIEFEGGRCHLIDDPRQVYGQAQQLADACGGHYLDQFTYAERATDWRGNNNIGQSIFDQMARERHPVPHWLVAGAGTGGTLATLGRWVRFAGLDSRVCGVDSERSVLFEHYARQPHPALLEHGSRIEGIGRPRVEASFVPDAIDAMVKVPDAWSVAAMQVLSKQLGRRVGPSTGSNFVAALACAGWMREGGQVGSVVTLLCDCGERYASSCYDRGWCDRQGIDEREAFDLLSRWFHDARPPALLNAALKVSVGRC